MLMKLRAITIIKKAIMQIFAPNQKTSISLENLYINN